MSLEEPLWLAVLESALDGIIVMDAQGIVREFNPAAQAIFGYSRMEAVGQPLGDLIVPADLRERHNKGLQRFLLTGDGPLLRRRVEIGGMRKDGSLVPVELAIVPFEAGGGRLFAGYLRDLTERERSREELRRKNELAIFLREVPLAASRAATLDEAVQVSLQAVCRFTGWPLGHSYFLDRERDVMVSRGIWQIPDDGLFTSFRTRSEAVEFRKGQGLPGRVWSSRQPLWVEDVQTDGNFPRAEWALDERLRAAFGFPVVADGEVQVILEFFTARAQREDIDLLDALEVAGRELGDVIERIAARERLAQANRRLQEASAARQRFLAQAAHELNNPLTTILLQLEMLTLGTPGAAQRRPLELLRGAAERIQLLGRDLLDASRVEGGELHIEPRPTDLGPLARDCAAALEPLATERKIRLVARADDVRADVDPHRLAQVIDNLLANALRFTPDGGEVAVEVRKEGPHAVLQVMDNGAGLPAEQRTRLFQPFGQLHKDTHRKGTGLGLFISKGIVEAHGGSIAATSPGPGKGSTFTVRLPLEGGRIQKDVSPTLPRGP